jgi:2-keto-3-deoxy-L-rhamnonate aldolase RhmA
MATGDLRARMRSGERLTGLFVKTPAHEVIELLAMAGLDFICLDAEHAPFDRGRLDLCLAMARAHDLPCLVRVAEAGAAAILQALDSGAAGVVVPHVDSAEKARSVARWSRFGEGGRGYAGSTRWAGFTTETMDTHLRRSREATVVIAQIEDPAALDELEGIAAVEGIDGLFVGAADLAVGLGVAGPADPLVAQAFTAIAAAAARHGKCLSAFAATAHAATAERARGAAMVFVGSEQSLILAGARAIVGTGGDGAD